MDSHNQAIKRRFARDIAPQGQTSFCKSLEHPTQDTMVWLATVYRPFVAERYQRHYNGETETENSVPS